MAKHYYIKRAGRISGPFSGSDVKAGVKMGRLLEQDLFSRSKDGPWRTLEGVFKKIRAKQTEYLLKTCPVCGKSLVSESKVCHGCRSNPDSPAPV